MITPTSPDIRGKVPHAVERADQIPARRYYDAEFYELEKEKLWPHVWQMACRLEEVPRPGDYIVYRIFDKSVIVVRTDERTVKAYHNHCRHRGVELVASQGHTRGGFICPFHGWRWDVDGKNTFVFEPETFAPETLCEAEINLKPVRLETWGGCAFINFDDNAPSLMESIQPFASQMDLHKVEELKVDWWLSARLPCNWKLAMEAFMEGYHVATTHPQLLPPGATNRPGESRFLPMPPEMAITSLWLTFGTTPPPAEVDSQAFIEANIAYLNTLSEGMAGMTHQQELDVARAIAPHTKLSSDPMTAAGEWRRIMNDAVMNYYARMGSPTGDLNALDAAGMANSVNFCFPHYFLLPMFGSASSYRIRPLGPEECLFELWSLTRYPPDAERPRPQPPKPLEFDDPAWPAIPKQDFSNLPRQQRGLHSGLDVLRLSQEMEGMVSNYHRLIDGYLAGVDKDRLAQAGRQVSGAIDAPIRDLGL